MYAHLTLAEVTTVKTGIASLQGKVLLVFYELFGVFWLFDVCCFWLALLFLLFLCLFVCLLAWLVGWFACVWCFSFVACVCVLFLSVGVSDLLFSFLLACLPDCLFF